MTVTGRPGRPWRTLAVAIAASVAVLAPGLPGGVASAAPNQAVDACPEAFPVADLTPGMVASGLTVEKGNVADPFTATVVGVIDDGIAPGLDMIIVETDSPAIQRAGGVWAGMSGSPVYAPDGRLIGAVAFGLSFGPSKIAGVTPAADMKALLSRPGPAPSPTATIDLPAALERRLVASDAATAAEAASGMRRLPIPLGVSGINQAHLGKVAERLEKELPGTHVYAAAAAPVGAAASPADIFPGSNFAAAVSYGELTAAGVGTTTAVCTAETNDFALAFGHPFTFIGSTSLSVHPANAVFVQPDVLAPFKVANPGGVVGTLDQDRQAGIRGLLGPVPPAIPVDSTVMSTDDGATRSGTTRVNMQQFVPEISAFHLLGQLDRVFDRIGGGTSQIRWVINGTRASGAPFSVDVTNMYANT
jgi:SpoIVB peptidase S55